MHPEFWGRLAGIILFVNAVPYLWRVIQGKVTPNITSWSLWSVIGLALLLTYSSQGAKENVWAAVLGFTNPSLVVAAASFRKTEWSPLSTMEKACIAIATVSILLWVVLRTESRFVQYALYLSILADVCAAIPTMRSYWTNPLEDRPFCWIVFCLGNALNFFAITDQTLSNYILPLWMTAGGSIIVSPLIAYRINHKTPFKEWI